MPSRLDTIETSNLLLSTLDEGVVPDQVKAGVADLFQVAKASIPPDSRLISFTDPKCPAAEAFRLLGVRIRHLRRSRRLNKLLITSTAPQEGKSMTAVNLAYSLGAGAKRAVLLLEGDLRRPTLAKYLGVGVRAGLSDYLQNTCDLENSVYRLDGLGFWLMPAGTIPGHPLELLQSSSMPLFTQTLERMFDWIIIDSPPFLPLADASIWERLADGVLVVARNGTTSKRKLIKGLGAIDETKMLCALINSSTNENATDYYYYAEEKS